MGRKREERFCCTIHMRQIPQAKSSTNPKPKSANSPVNPPFNILIAEDEPSVAFSVSFALKADGHKVEIVADGEEALFDLASKPGAFDVLITDHNMPHLNGVELVKRLRDTAFRGKIVILSAHLSDENRAAYLALGVDMMIPKPFDVHLLRATIREIGNGGAISPLPAPEVYKLLRLGLPEEGEEMETP